MKALAQNLYCMLNFIQTKVEWHFIRNSSQMDYPVRFENFSTMWKYA